MDISASYFPTLSSVGAVSKISGVDMPANFSVAELTAIGFGMLVSVEGVTYLIIIKPINAGVTIEDNTGAVPVVHKSAPATPEILAQLRIHIFGPRRPHLA